MKAKDGKSAFLRLAKMLQNLGVPLWSEKPNVLTAYCPSHDAGSDIDLATRIAEKVCELTECNFIFKINGLEHQVQLSIKLGLKVADVVAKLFLLPHTHYSSTAKLMHWIREPGHSNALFSNWVDRFGSVFAVKFARNKAPKSIGGLWGSISACESYLCAPMRDVDASLKHWNQVLEFESTYFN